MQFKIGDEVIDKYTTSSKPHIMRVVRIGVEITVKCECGFSGDFPESELILFTPPKKVIKVFPIVNFLNSLNK